MFSPGTQLTEYYKCVRKALRCLKTVQHSTLLLALLAAALQVTFKCFPRMGHLDMTFGVKVI